MHADPEQTSRAFKWFLGAGAFAVAFAGFLWFTDDALSNSTRERDLGATLEELRGAQHAVAGRGVDDRHGGASSGHDARDAGGH